MMRLVYENFDTFYQKWVWPIFELNIFSCLDLNQPKFKAMFTLHVLWF